MKNFIFTLLTGSFFFGLSLNAQDCTYYFPVKPGTTMEMKSYDGKDKLIGSSKTKILNKTGAKVSFETETFDAKGKSTSKGNYEVSCENGEFVVDMKSYLKGIDMNAYKDMEVKFDAKNISIPANLKAGQKLNDGEVNMAVSNSIGMKIISMTVKITNRTVEGFEEITTPAGTFKCVKISSDFESKMLFKVKAKMVEWISEKAGTVRTESRDEKGKLTSYTLLTAFNE
jgi:hypothetical protein